MSSQRVHQLCEWVECILRDGVNLTAREEEFIESMQDRIDLYGERTILSDKQADWIESIYTNRVP